MKEATIFVKLSLFKCCSLALFFLPLLSLPKVCAQEQFPPQEEKIISTVSDDTYDKVLDLLFPRDVLEGEFGYAFVLRYKPSFNMESQVTILNRAGNLEIIEYTPLNGSIYSQLNRMLWAKGKINVAEAAKLIQIQKRAIRISPSDVQQLRESFYSHLRRASAYESKLIKEKMDSITVTEDGTQYLLWYRGKERLHYELFGSDVESPPREDEYPLIEWMKSVRRAVKKETELLTKQRG
jgi:hypothetical protein